MMSSTEEDESGRTPEALVGEVRRAMQEERWADARDLVRTAGGCVAEDAELAWNSGWASLKLGLVEEATELLRIAVAAAPADPMAHWALAHACWEGGDTLGAEVEFVRSLALRNSYMARQNLGCLYQESGRLKEAKTVFIEGMRLAPDDFRIVEAYGDFLCDIGVPEDAEPYYDLALRLKGQEKARKE